MQGRLAQVALEPSQRGSELPNLLPHRRAYVSNTFVHCRFQANTDLEICYFFAKSLSRRFIRSFLWA